MSKHCIMLLFLSLIGIFLSAILLYFNARKYRSSIYLGAFFLIVSLYGFNQWVLLYSNSVLLVSLVYTHITFLFYLIGPLLYWYIRSVLTDKVNLQKNDLFHLIPMVIYLVASLPYLFSSYSYKVEVATSIVNVPGYLGNIKVTILSEIFSVSSVYIFRPLLVWIYTVWSIALFIRFLIKNDKTLIFSHQKFMTKWLSVLLGFQFVLITSHLLMMMETFLFDYDNLFHTLNTLQFLSVLAMAGLLISPFFFPGILYGLPRLPESILELQIRVETKKIIDDVKKNSPNFESDYMQLIEHKSMSCMKELQPYLKPEFNLNQFSVLIQIPVHHVTYFFREIKKQSFSDFRNEWRVNHAKALILEPKSSNWTLEAIGLQSGFATRNTFFTAFKKTEGISPSTFAIQSRQTLFNSEILY